MSKSQIEVNKDNIQEMGKWLVSLSLRIDEIERVLNMTDEHEQLEKELEKMRNEWEMP